MWRALLFASAVSVGGCGILLGLGSYASDGAGGAGGGGTSAVTGGGGAAPEPREMDCTDELDDDGDLLVDCVDDDCDAFECIDVPRAPWTGPFYVATSAMATPTCADGAEATLLGGSAPGMTEPASCAPCGCTSSGCSMTVGYHDSEQCADALISLGMAMACADTPLVNARALFVGGSGSNTCAPRGGEVLDIPDVSYQAPLWGCIPEYGGGCGAFIGCVAPIAPPFEQTCVYQDGVIDRCPPQWPNKTVITATINDNRRCNTCACNPRSCADSAVLVYDQASCSTTPASVDVGLCQASPLPTIGSFEPATEHCSPFGGGPVGTVVEGPRTLCCN